MGAPASGGDDPPMHQTAAVSRLLLLADGLRGTSAGPGEHAARVRRYRLARLKLDDTARAARLAQLRAGHD